MSHQARNAREANDTSYEWTEDGVTAAVQEDEGWDKRQGGGVVAQGGPAGCGGAGAGGRVPLELEVVVGSRDVLSADTLVRADHRATGNWEGGTGGGGAG